MTQGKHTSSGVCDANSLYYFVTGCFNQLCTMHKLVQEVIESIASTSSMGDRKMFYQNTKTSAKKTASKKEPTVSMWGDAEWESMVIGLMENGLSFDDRMSHSASSAVCSIHDKHFPGYKAQTIWECMQGKAFLWWWQEHEGEYSEYVGGACGYTYWSPLTMIIRQWAAHHK